MENLKERAGDQLETRIHEGKQRAAGTLNDVAESLLSSSQTMRDRGNESVSRYMEQAADRFDRMASYLDRADVHQMVDQVEAFGRRRPGAFIAGAFAVGFLASRFLKSSRGEFHPGIRPTTDDRSAIASDLAGRTIHYGPTASLPED